MLFDGSVAGPEEVESEDRVFMAPFPEGLAAVGGDEAAAGCAGREALIGVVACQEAGEGKEDLGEGEGPE